MFIEIGYFIATLMIGALPIAGDYVDFTPPAPTGWVGEIRYADGSVAGRHQSVGSIPVDMDRIPQRFLDALIATEDRRFRSHPGVDPRALAAAALDTLRGNFRGGSGLAQQMVKNTITGGDQTLSRKITEAVLALRITSTKGRDFVLKTYLENTWFGRGQTGVALAPQAWFGKDWAQLSIGEIAFLAGLPKGASRLDPEHHPDRARARRNHVLSRLRAVGKLGYFESLQAGAGPVDVIPSRGAAARSWGINATLAQDISQMLDAGAPRTNLVIETTIDPAWQAIAGRILADALERRGTRSVFARASKSELALAEQGVPDAIGALKARASQAPHPVLLSGSGEESRQAIDLDSGDKIRVSLAPGVTAEAGDILTLEPGARARHGTDLQGAVIALNPQTGEVLASIGGYSARLSQFDRTRALRQPGSAVKPFLWSAALELGILPDAYISNERTTFYVNGEPWSPENYDHSQSGSVPLYQGLERSLNIVAANLVFRIGAENMATVAQLTGAYRREPMRAVPSAALGSSETTLLDLTSGYGALVNDAVPRHPVLIRSIRAHGEVLHDAAQDTSQPILSRGTVIDILSMMRGVVERGTASIAMRSMPVTIAGKTGTTQDHRDAWFIGVTPHLALGVWIGRDDNESMGQGLTGGTIAARISAEILTIAHQQGLISATGLRPNLPSPKIGWPPMLLSREPSPPLNSPDQPPYSQPTLQQLPTPHPQGELLDYFVIVDEGAHLRP